MSAQLALNDLLGSVGQIASMRDYTSFDQFLNAMSSDVYPEAPSEPHLSITRTTIAGLLADGVIAAGARVLDVGCGQGLALEQFRAAGLEAVGITLGSDCSICQSKGFEAHEMDQNFMAFPAESFDFLWCRHVLEHSIAPLIPARLEGGRLGVRRGAGT